MTSTHFVNSEEYLTQGAFALIDRVFAPLSMDTDAATGAALADKLRVRVGYPTTGGIRLNGATLGQCIGPQHSEGGYTEIFVNPRLSDPSEMLAVVVHELVHAAVGHKLGHGKTFTKMLAKVGITGLTSKTAATPSDELQQTIDDIVADLGTMPHDAITLTSLPKKQTTRLLKVICVNDNCPFPGVSGGKPYTVRMSFQTATDGGTPFCGSCEQRMHIYLNQQAPSGGRGAPEEPEETDKPVAMEPPPPSDGEGDPEDGEESEDDGSDEAQKRREQDNATDAEGDEDGESEEGEEYEADYSDEAIDTEGQKQDEGDVTEDEETNHIGKMEDHEGSDGGIASEKIKSTRIKIAEAHPLDLDCECEACVEGRKLAGL